MQDPSTRVLGAVRCALVGLLVLALVTVLPTLGLLGSTPELAAVALVTLAVAGGLARVPFASTALLRLVDGVTVADEAGSRVLRTRTTDPAHHPLAPRAPGLA